MKRTSLTWPPSARCFLHSAARMLSREGREAGHASAHRFVFNGHVLHVPSGRREILRCAQNDMFCNSYKRDVSVIPSPNCDEAIFEGGADIPVCRLDFAQNNRPTDRQTCHPEEAVLPTSGSSAGRLTKDLLRHRLIPERHLSFAAT
jgi:hypothetical protein